MNYWANKHQCVSCQYWDGERSVCHDSRVVEAPSGAKGICRGNNRQYRGKQVASGLYIGGERCYCMWYCLSE